MVSAVRQFRWRSWIVARRPEQLTGCDMVKQVARYDQGQAAEMAVDRLTVTSRLPTHRTKNTDTGSMRTNTADSYPDLLRNIKWYNLVCPIRSPKQYSIWSQEIQDLSNGNVMLELLFFWKDNVQCPKSPETLAARAAAATRYILAMELLHLQWPWISQSASLTVSADEGPSVELSFLGCSFDIALLKVACDDSKKCSEQLYGRS